MRGILINHIIHTGEDIGLVMTEKTISSPTPKTYCVDVPGRDGTLDLSEFLTGNIQYDNRQLKFKFVGDGSRKAILSLINEMMLYHGQMLTIADDDFPDWYYIGRATIAPNDCNSYVEFEMSVDAEPFRYAIEETNIKLTVSGSKTVTIDNQGIDIVPTITTTAETAVIKEDKRYSLGIGTFMFQDFLLEHGSSSITFEGNSNVTIKFREAML